MTPIRNRIMQISGFSELVPLIVSRVHSHFSSISSKDIHTCDLHLRETDLLSHQTEIVVRRDGFLVSH